MNSSRRLLLQAGFAAGIGFAFVAANRIACRFVPRNHPDFFSLLDAAPSDETAMRVGRLELARPGASTDLAGIETALRDKPLLARAAAISCARTRGDLVRDQCANDFEQGRVVELDGWLLSETEASLCAARALVTTV